MRRMLRQAEILRRLRRACRHDVPAGAAAAEMVERGEQAGEVIRFAVGRRRGCDQADPLGGDRDCGEPGDRLEAEALRVADIVGQGRSVGKEDRVELVRFGLLRQLLIKGDVEDAVRGGALVAPRRLVMAARIDEEIERKPSIAHA
jgi:hypothetical protein